MVRSSGFFANMTLFVPIYYSYPSMDKYNHQKTYPSMDKYNHQKSYPSMDKYNHQKTYPSMDKYNHQKNRSETKSPQKGQRD
jgi:hypothetical protein